MVKLLIKKGDENQFLLEATVNVYVDDLLANVVAIYNGRLKVQRTCAEIEELSDHGITLPINMQGLTDDQLKELKLEDDFSQHCQPSGGYVINKDDIGKRNGQAPSEKMAEVLKKTVKEGKDMIAKKNVEAGVCVTHATIQRAMELLRGAVMIVYPMGLPPYDPVQLEFDNAEDLSGTQAALEVIELDNACLWWAGKELLKGKKLCDFIGMNEKTKIVCKLQKRGQGAPAREPVVSENEQKMMMTYYHRKQEELKKLEEESDDTFLNSEWADSQKLKREFQGLNNVQYRMGGKM